MWVSWSPWAFLLTFSNFPYSLEGEALENRLRHESQVGGHIRRNQHKEYDTSTLAWWKLRRKHTPLEPAQGNDGEVSNFPRIMQRVSSEARCRLQSQWFSFLFFFLNHIILYLWFFMLHAFWWTSWAYKMDWRYSLLCMFLSLPEKMFQKCRRKMLIRSELGNVIWA